MTDLWAMQKILEGLWLLGKTVLTHWTPAHLASEEKVLHKKIYILIYWNKLNL